MKKTSLFLIAFLLVAAVVTTYRAPVVEARINAVVRLIKDLANGNLPVVASSTAEEAVETSMLESGLQPSHVVKYGGFANWTGHGASYKLGIVGALSTDLIQATIKTAPSEAAYIKSAVLKNNTSTFTLSAANTSDDAVIAYTVYRAAP
ncbi:MAG: hypothetical protein KAR06_02400 [Deltaproteobacteria bacterium]|nr:hypothetical protein [Deltaproteobacteria bacterium]